MGESVADRVAGAIVGLAVGDALGYPHEFRTVAQVRRELGPDGITDFVRVKDPHFTRPYILGPDHPPGTFTDDTQMSVCVAEALVAGGRGPRDALLDDMARRFVGWCFSPDNNRAPGEATSTACERLRDGVPRTASGVEGSKGAGANMRVVPVGLYYADPDEAAEVARQQADITHHHPAAREAAAATALAAWLLVRDVPPVAVADEVRRRCGGRSPDFDEIAGRFDAALAREPDEVLVRRDRSAVALGEGWVAEEAVFAALYCGCRAPDSFRDAVLMAANTDGDSDTVATLAGGFLGARLGLGAIPEAWRRGLERSADLHDLGRRLAAARG
ncbi:ADP-ribosylglycohydrolase family protein [Urbifossiella limnaea]|uniref:ADP-ribosyl-[dinitrogen reductase] glycohydrolase n=1 Tax=Urbifossiella limnaea TaxID=2528023 RepID=A0A517Y014_9BACT|nr:ADP-ribosylglycohydrolase family protein [Urbifossiella limnaea]QDU23102.1 ADP-ribosyl-[dinitrogen reductase] glycohydrolase [Urbifossiella limnaea]